MPDQRWPRASARSSAASVRARPSSSSSTQVRSTRRTAPPGPARGSRRAARPRRSPAAVEHPGLRAHREAVEREGEARIARRRAHQRARRLAIGRHRLDAPHQHVEQPLARRLLGHVGFTAGQHLAVELLHVRGEDRERAGELAAQRRERDVGAPRDIAEADLLEALLGEQRHQRRDDLFAVGAAGRRQGGRGFGAVRRSAAACGPWRAPVRLPLPAKQ